MKARSAANLPLRGVSYALLSAFLFGLSTPFSKLLLSEIKPVALAGLLYLGSGLGLSLVLLARRIAGGPGAREVSLVRADLPYLVGAVVLGGILAPLSLMLGLNHSQASGASLLLNLEGVFTALLAWMFFKENFDRRIVAGMLLITAGSMLLSFFSQGVCRLSGGSLLIAVSCFAWAVDNNLTRKVSAADPVQVAAIKGLVAGVFNCALALAIGCRLPGGATLLCAMLVGFCCWGLSLVFFILSLRHIGAARTAAYFAVAPFLGALVALFLLKESLSPSLALAASLMALGIYLHLSERHEHEHSHEPVTHEHEHEHGDDVHHEHVHQSSDPPGDRHNHLHTHGFLTHKHPHYPDWHHHHEHREAM